jgi:tetratricopeptide (TPR) repeat protein
MENKMAISPKTAYLQYPLGIRMTLLMHYDDPNYPSFYNEASKLENIIVDRNIKGNELEKRSNIDEAITVYESNVSDFADTPAPYERLRIIYTKRKQYVEAIRVCEAFIEMCQKSSHAVIMELGDKELAKQLADRGKYPEHIDKLKRKLITKPLTTNH